MARSTTVVRSIRAVLFAFSLIVVSTSPAVFAAQSVKAYVANGGGNSVSVINAASNTVAATISVGNGPPVN